MQHKTASVNGLYLYPWSTWPVGLGGQKQVEVGGEEGGKGLLASGRQEGLVDHRLPCFPAPMALNWSLTPPPCPGLGTSVLGESPELFTHTVKPALLPSTCQNLSEREKERERNSQLHKGWGRLNKNGHGTGVGKKEKLSTADMSFLIILDKGILGHPSGGL